MKTSTRLHHCSTTFGRGDEARRHRAVGAIHGVTALLIALILATVVAGTTGCSPSRATAVNEYRLSLFRIMAQGDSASVREHLILLRTIIDESWSRHEKVPPGICAEYGAELFRIGMAEEGEKYLTMEREIYPESRLFIHRLRVEAEGGAL